ncbi:MAG: AAA family ATPase, partial [Candidatus Methylomirabilaceae bacterium]
MVIGTELRFAPPVAAMEAFIAPYREWFESVLGCPWAETLTLEIEGNFGKLAAEDLLQGVALDRQCLALAETLRPAVIRWAIPPVSPRISLAPGRDRDAPMAARALAWDPYWQNTPVALWFHDLRHAVVTVQIPYVSFARGLTHEWRAWLIVNRAEVAQALTLLRPMLNVPRKAVRVVGGEDIPLPQATYDWDRVVLDSDQMRLVRQDFESFLQREAWFKQHRLPFRRGYLFYGPPGNGKTSAIRVMATHPMILVHTLDFSNEELGNEALTLLFKEASRSAPALVVFEDLDRLYGKTSPGDNRTRITLQHLLNCLDGLVEHEGVIVVATANDPTALDPAILRRPGRFDRTVPFRPPAADLRCEYLLRLSGGSFDEQTLTRAVSQSDG